MTGEIDKDFYCSAFMGEDGDCFRFDPDGHGEGDCCNLFASKCPAYHHKWPNPEQFEKEYGKAYPDDGAVYFLEFFGGHSYAPDWVCRTLKEANGIGGHYAGKIVCACTPFGKPPDDWRPE